MIRINPNNALGASPEFSSRIVGKNEAACAADAAREAPESNQTEEYVKLFDEVEHRRGVVDSIGIGFEIRPEQTIVRNVRRTSVKREVEIAA